MNPFKIISSEILNFKANIKGAFKYPYTYIYVLGNYTNIKLITVASCDTTYDKRLRQEKTTKLIEIQQSIQIACGLPKHFEINSKFFTYLNLKSNKMRLAVLHRLFLKECHTSVSA